MTTNTRTHNGIRYNIVHRDDCSMAESPWYWQGTDGSILEPTDDEIERRLPPSFSITD